MVDTPRFVGSEQRPHPSIPARARITGLCAGRRHQWPGGSFNGTAVAGDRAPRFAARNLLLQPSLSLDGDPEEVIEALSRDHPSDHAGRMCAVPSFERMSETLRTLVLRKQTTVRFVGSCEYWRSAQCNPTG